MMIVVRVNETKRMQAGARTFVPERKENKLTTEWGKLSEIFLQLIAVESDLTVIRSILRGLLKNQATGGKSYSLLTFKSRHTLSYSTRPADAYYSR